eukprot:2374717-Alexandrium_andersonii.AAC.1
MQSLRTMICRLARVGRCVLGGRREASLFPREVRIGAGGVRVEDGPVAHSEDSLAVGGVALDHDCGIQLRVRDRAPAAGLDDCVRELNQDDLRAAPAHQPA